MDWLAPVKRLIICGKKYRYALLILLLGILLMLIPGKESDAEEIVEPVQEESAEISISEELSLILSKIEGVGKAQVMLTVAAGEETVYQSNSGGTSENLELTTVTVTDAQRNETGLIRQVNPPVYLGAIVVCQGADSPTVCLQIVEAVSRVTGLSTNCISVLKMK